MNDKEIQNLALVITKFALENHVDSEKTDWFSIVDYAHAAYLSAIERIKEDHGEPNGVTVVGDFDYRKYE